MHTRNAIERLANAGRPLLAAADALVDGRDQEQILDRIVVANRPPVRRRRPLALALVAAAVIGVAVVAVTTRDHAASTVKSAGRHHHLALTGASIQTAGYHFKTPAGFAASATSCLPAQSSSVPEKVMDGFAAAGSADGGCVEAFFRISPDGTALDENGATPVDVGSFQGYYVPPDASGQSTLYVELPQGGSNLVYLVLFSEGLTEDQLVAVAQSGLPGSP